MWLKFVKLLAAVAFMALLGLWGLTLKEDLNLTFALTRDKTKTYIEIGGIFAIRRIGEDTWNLAAESVVRKTPVEELKVIETKIEGPSGLRTINAPEGFYDSKKQRLVLLDADGLWERAEYPFKWSSPHVQWEQKDDIWTFPRGVTVSGDVYSLTGGSAVVKKQREIHVENGCVRWWKQ